MVRASPDDAPTLSVAGDGPLLNEVQAAIRHNVHFLGLLDPRAATRAARALVVVVPSIWPEPLPLVALAALAEGTPVVTFDNGSLGAVLHGLPRCVAPFGDFPALARARDVTTSTDWQHLSERSMRLWESYILPPVNVDSPPQTGWPRAHAELGAEPEDWDWLRGVAPKDRRSDCRAPGPREGRRGSAKLGLV